MKESEHLVNLKAPPVHAGRKALSQYRQDSAVGGGRGVVLGASRLLCSASWTPGARCAAKPAWVA